MLFKAFKDIETAAHIACSEGDTKCVKILAVRAGLYADLLAPLRGFSSGFPKLLMKMFKDNILRLNCRFV